MSDHAAANAFVLRALTGMPIPHGHDLAQHSLWSVGIRPPPRRRMHIVCTIAAKHQRLPTVPTVLFLSLTWRSQKGYIASPGNGLHVRESLVRSLGAKMGARPTYAPDPVCMSISPGMCERGCMCNPRFCSPSCFCILSMQVFLLFVLCAAAHAGFRLPPECEVMCSFPPSPLHPSFPPPLPSALVQSYCVILGASQSMT